MRELAGCEPLPDIWRDWIESDQFGCLAARSSLHRRQAYFLRVGGFGASGQRRVLAALAELAGIVARPESETNTLIAAFDESPALSAAQFHDRFWTFLRDLRDADRTAGFGKAEGYSSDPQAPNFALSIAGEPYFAVGLTPASGRISRRAPGSAVAFNSHRQFARLRATGRYGGLQAQIRRRELRIQGSINPTLGEFGVNSDAPQYTSHVPPGWDPRDPGHINF